MPSSLKLKISLMTITSLFILFTVLAFSARHDFATTEPSRNLAVAEKGHPTMGKSLAPLSVQIAPLQDIPEFDDQEVTLNGFVTANAYTGSVVQYHWDLPAGVSVLSGDINGSFSNIKSGDTFEVELRVTGFSREVGKHIILGAKVKHGEDELGHSALIASRPEDSMEYIAPQMREYAVETRSKEFKNGRLAK